MQAQHSMSRLKIIELNVAYKPESLLYFKSCMNVAWSRKGSNIRDRPMCLMSSLKQIKRPAT